MFTRQSFPLLFLGAIMCRGFVAPAAEPEAQPATALWALVPVVGILCVGASYLFSSPEEPPDGN